MRQLSLPALVLTLASLALPANAAPEMKRKGECGAKAYFVSNGTVKTATLYARQGLSLMETDPSDPSYRVSNSTQRFSPISLTIGGTVLLTIQPEVMVLEDRRVMNISASYSEILPAGESRLQDSQNKKITLVKNDWQEKFPGFMKGIGAEVILVNPEAENMAPRKDLEAFDYSLDLHPTRLLFVKADVWCDTIVTPDL